MAVNMKKLRAKYNEYVADWDELLMADENDMVGEDTKVKYSIKDYLQEARHQLRMFFNDSAIAEAYEDAIRHQDDEEVEDFETRIEGIRKFINYYSKYSN